MMDPLTLTLLGYPLSIIANLTYDQLIVLKNKFSEFESLEKLYIKSFQSVIKRYGDQYPEYTKEYETSQKLKKAIRKDKRKLVKAISECGVTDFTSFSDSKFHEEIAAKIIDSYGFSEDENRNVATNIIIDSFKYYRSTFFNLMNEKDGIQLILMECLKLNKIIDLLHKIESKSIDRGEFDNIRRIVFDNYRRDNERYVKCVKDYDRYIKEKFKYLELRGFSPKVSGKEVQMELDDIFVPLSIDEQRRFIPNISDEYSYTKSKKVGTSDILKYRSLVILGDPGSGKSTLLKYLALQVVGLRRKKHIIKNVIPVFFRLSDYSDYYKKYKKSIYEFLTNHFDSQYQHIFKESFEYSNLLILMDGLDEITNTPLRLKVTEQVNDLIARYPNNRYIVTSRIVGYQEAKLGSNFNHYKLLPFREEEIEIFANQWYRSIAQHTDKDYEAAKSQAKSLYDSISRNPSVLKLASNPLLMTIIAMIHYQGKKLPSKRIELYEISTDTFLEHWVQLRIGDEKQLKDKTEIIEILAPIAFKIHETKSNALIEEQEFKREFLDTYQSIHTNSSPKDAKRICDEFIDFLRKQTGFFYEKGVDDDNNRYYGFMHLTFEEYLAATELVSRWSEDELELKNYVFQSRWTEIIRLAAAQIRISFRGKAGRIQTSKFIRNILEVEDNFPHAYRPLQLACLIISDDVSISDDLFNEIIDKVFGVLSNHSNKSLIKSFSILFKELSLCDKRDFLLSRIKKSVHSHNKILTKNIAVVLAENFEHEYCKNLLQGNLNTAILNHTLSLAYIHGIKKSDIYRDHILPHYLKKTKQLQNEPSIVDVALSSIAANSHPSSIMPTDFLIKFIEKINVKKKHDALLSLVLVLMIYNVLIKNRALNNLIEFCNLYPHKYTDALKKRYTKIEILNNIKDSFSSNIITNDYNNYVGFHMIMFKTEKYFSVCIIEDNFKNLHIFNSKKTELNLIITNLNKSITHKNIENIQSAIYNFVGPIKQENNLDRFINSKSLFTSWEYYPFKHIERAKDELSQIILENSRYYLQLHESPFDEIKDYNIADFLKLQIPAPVKLLACIKSEYAYETSLIDESIDFYNNCDDEKLKNGVYNIIYSVLQFNYD